MTLAELVRVLEHERDTDERAMVEAVAEVVSGTPEFCPETWQWHLDGLDHLSPDEIDALLEDIRRVLPPGWRALWSMFDVRIYKEPP